MIFRPLKLAGAYLIEPERLEDERGFFARTFCGDEFAARGLVGQFVQCNISYNRRRDTLRGMHYQPAPHEEIKLVRCTRGAIYDVIVDIRRDSPTFAQWAAAELTEDNRHSLYIPAGMAHGFQTLQDGCEVFYQMSQPYHAASAAGIRWDDPAVGIVWPAAQNRIIAPKDLAFADLAR